MEKMLFSSEKGALKVPLQLYIASYAPYWTQLISRADIISKLKN